MYLCVLCMYTVLGTMLDAEDAKSTYDVTSAQKELVLGRRQTCKQYRRLL